MDDLHLRWTIRRDMPEVLFIENASFGERAWSESEFIARLRTLNTISIVAEYRDQIVGFVVYELHKDRIELINLAVRPDYRRMGVGTTLLAMLKSKKLCGERRASIECCAWERNLQAQVFLRSAGFMCVDTWPAWYHDVNDDAYRFLFRHEWSACDAQRGNTQEAVR